MSSPQFCFAQSSHAMTSVASPPQVGAVAQAVRQGASIAHRHLSSKAYASTVVEQRSESIGRGAAAGTRSRHLMQLPGSDPPSAPPSPQPLAFGSDLQTVSHSVE